jgi:quercetin dioxygenase-like cupin family protein
MAGDVYTFLATGDDTGGAYCLMEFLVPPGGGPPPHRQTREDEGFTVLEGQFTFHLDGRVIPLGPGDFVNVPRGALHHFRGEGPGMGRMLVINAPAGVEKFFAEVGVPVADRHAQAPPLSEAEIARMRELAPHYGIEFP